MRKSSNVDDANDVCYSDTEKTQELIRDKSITTNELRVYCLMFSIMDSDNYIYCTPEEIATVLKRSLAVVNKSIESLIKRGILLKIIEEGRYIKYRLNSEYVWRRHELRR